jgi:hypothetical protein
VQQVVAQLRQTASNTAAVGQAARALVAPRQVGQCARMRSAPGGAGQENSDSLLLLLGDTLQITIHNAAMTNVINGDNFFLNFNLIDYPIIANTKAI